MFGRKTPFHCYNMYLTAAVLVSCVLSIWLWSLCFMVCYGGGSLSFSPFSLFFFWLLLYPYCYIFLFRWLSDIWFCSGNPGGWRSFILHDVMQQPDNPKTVLLFLLLLYFLPWDSDSYLLLPCSLHTWYWFAAKAAALPVCLSSAITNGVQWFLFQRLVRQIPVLYSPAPWGQTLVIPISFHGPWSKDCFNTSFPSFLGYCGASFGYYQYVHVLHTWIPVSLSSIVWIIGMCTCGGCLIFIIPQFQY